MDESMILPHGAHVMPLKKILNPNGDIYHALKSTDSSYSGFGEAYFSTIHQNTIKGWKKHTEMTLNLVVPVGEVEFYLYEDLSGHTYTIRIGENNYQRLTVAPGLWMAFRGVADGLNLVMNVANIPHDPAEAISAPLETFPL
jgi:dTDP-4-dehydrorhamnose 3,5-epimerase